MNAFRLGLAAAALAVGFSRAGAAPEGTLSPASLQRGKAATVLVDLGEEGSGSAFLVHSCGLFVTARHVVDAVPNGGVFKLVVHSGDSGQKTLNAHVVSIFEEADLALIKSDEAPGVEPLTLAGEEGLAELLPVVEFGYPFGKLLAGAGNPNPAISVNAGHVSSLRRDGAQLEHIQLDAATNPGNSGGPVLNLNGEVIGVLTSGLGENLNFAVPVGRISAALKQPIAALRAPAIGYRQRAEVRTIEIETLPSAPFPPDGEITLVLGDRGGAPRTFKAAHEGAKWSVVAAPCPPAEAAHPLRLRVEAVFKEMTVAFNTDDLPVQVGGRQLQLSDLRSFESREVENKGKMEQRRQTVLTHFDQDRGTFATIPELPKGLPKLRGALNGIELNPLAATRFTVGAIQRGPVKMPYDLTVSAHGKPLSTSHGVIAFTDAPAGLRAPDDDDEDGSHMVIFTTRHERNEGLRLDRLIDPAQDARQGTWVRKFDTVETAAEPVGWCELPAVPAGDYAVHAVITPFASKRGELLLLLPFEHRQSLLHLDGAKGRASLELTQPGAGWGESTASIPPFEAGHDFAVHLAVSARGGYARIIFSLGEGHPFIWSGKSDLLAAPKDLPVAKGRLALGHHDLAMSVESLRVDPRGGELDLLREMPDSVESQSEELVASFPLDRPPRTELLASSVAEAAGAKLFGKYEIGPVPGAPSGGGALRFGPEKPGTLHVNVGPAINSAWFEDRTHSFWFNADADPKNTDHCRILLDDGGVDKGLVVYLQEGVLRAGGWFPAEKWTTWLEAPGIIPGQWYHVALVLDGQTKKRAEAFRLYLNGAKVASGLGKPLGPHEQTCYGGVLYSTRTKEGKPKQEFTEARRFIGLLDELQIYNSRLTDLEIKILAGGTFHFDREAKP